MLTLLALACAPSVHLPPTPAALRADVGREVASHLVGVLHREPDLMPIQAGTSSTLVYPFSAVAVERRCDAAGCRLVASTEPCLLDVSEALYMAVLGAARTAVVERSPVPGASPVAVRLRGARPELAEVLDQALGQAGPMVGGMPGPAPSAAVILLSAASDATLQVSLLAVPVESGADGSFGARAGHPAYEVASLLDAPTSASSLCGAW